MSESKDKRESFLSRWARKKVEAKDEVATPAPATAPQNTSIGAPFIAEMPEKPQPEPTSSIVPEAAAGLPSVDSLTHEADFSPFMAKEVDPGLRNLAMKKLFTDPHYGFSNMDKLDIYIDDYSKSEPIPLEALKRMHQAKSLFLFDDEEDENKGNAIEPAQVSAKEVPISEATVDPNVVDGKGSEPANAGTLGDVPGKKNTV